MAIIHWNIIVNKHVNPSQDYNEYEDTQSQTRSSERKSIIWNSLESSPQSKLGNDNIVIKNDYETIVIKPSCSIQGILNKVSSCSFQYMNIFNNEALVVSDISNRS